MNQRKTSSGEKLHLLLATLALVLSFLAILLGLLTKEGFIGPELWDMVSRGRAIPQGLGPTLFKWGLISLPFTLFWNVGVRFAQR